MRGSQPRGVRDPARPLWPWEKEDDQEHRSLARVPSALWHSAGGGAVLGPQASTSRACLSRGSRLQPSGLLLSLLCRLKTATVPELTPGDPESFLFPPTPLAQGTLCSQRLLNSGRLL